MITSRTSHPAARASLRAKTRRAARLAGSAALSLALAALAAPAHATEGYFALSYGTAQRGVAGAGVAFAQDAMSGAINPASLASVDHEFSLGAELFSPRRGYTGTGTGFVAGGEVTSGHDYFIVPNMAYNHPLANGAVLNIAVYGNGGMNTSYPDVANPACGNFGGGSGVFCGGKAGVDLTQLFVSATYAQRSGRFSWGISPTLAVQGFSARGLGAFGVSAEGLDISSGGGLRAGVQYQINEQLTLGLSGQTRFQMSKFDDYATLFEDGGAFDIPASITAGLAWKARPDLTLMLDYQRIFYNAVGAVGNATDAGPMGAPGGAGFGWDDVNVVRLGAEWQQSPEMIWRMGYAHATNPVGPEDVGLNILAPGIVQDHLSVGGSRRVTEHDKIDFSLSYVFENKVAGDLSPMMGGCSVELEMDQLSAAIGWTRRF